MSRSRSRYRQQEAVYLQAHRKASAELESLKQVISDFLYVELECEVVDVDYRIEEGKVCVRAFAKSSGKNVLLVDRDFLPYLYAVPSEDTQLKELKEVLETKNFKDEGENLPVLETEVVQRTDLDKEVSAVKVYTSIPPKIPKLRRQVQSLDAVDDTREFDIPFYKRWLVDNKIYPVSKVKATGQPIEHEDFETCIELEDIETVERETSESYRHVAFDLETFQGKVIMASLWGKNTRKLLTTEEIDREFVETVEDEAELIRSLVEFVRDTDVDTLTGYNTDEFDFHRLRERAESLGLDLSMGRNGEKMRFKRRGRFSSARLKGRMHLDLYPFVQHVLGPGLDTTTLDLDSVAEELLGENKDDLSWEEMKEMWREKKDLERFADYALKDAELAYRLGERIVPQVMELSRLTGLIPFDACRLTYGQLTENFLVREAYKRGMLAPNRPFQQEQQRRRREDDVEGGFVYQPEPGLHDEVAIFDFRSLYPTVMVSHNISPDTLNVEDCENQFEVEDLDLEFCQDQQGFFPELIEGLVEERAGIKQEIAHAEEGTDEYLSLRSKSTARKVLANAFYGYLAYAGARWYSDDCASAVTYLGREYIQDSIDTARDQGFEVVYGDSVEGSRPVLVKKPSGEIAVRQIESLFNQGSAESRPDGKVSADVEGWEALSVNGALETEWKPIRAVIRHKSDKELVRMQHKFGESVTTRDHSYITGIDTKQETKPSELERPLRVNIPDEENLRRIDLFSRVNGYTRDFVDSRGTGEATKKTKRFHSENAEIWFGLEGQHDTTRPKVKRYIESDREKEALTRLLAAYAAEGSSSTKETTESKYGASISSTDKTWLKQIEDDMEVLFSDTKASVIQSSKGVRKLEYDGGEKQVSYSDETLKLQLMNELSAVILRELSGQRSDGKRVPDLVFNLGDRYKRLYIRNLVRGDGSREFPRYSEEYSKRHFDYETKSRELAAGLSTLLNQLDRKHSFKYRDEKETYTIRTCDSYRDGRKPQLQEREERAEYVYDLDVEGNDSFVDAVGGIALHNTDSVMLKRQNLRSHLDGFLEDVNSTLPEFMELEFEGYFERGFFTSTGEGRGAKKKYALLDEDGDLKIVGFEQVRRDWAPIAKNLQRKVLEKVLNEKPDEAASLVMDTVERLKDGEVPVEELRIYSTLTKEPEEYDSTSPHVEAVKKARDRGDDIEPEATVSYVITRGGGGVSQRAELLKYAESYDPSYYVENQVVPAALRVLKVFGYTDGQLQGEGKQTGLGSF